MTLITSFNFLIILFFISRIALTVLSEKQHARNTLTPDGLSSLGLQINEKLGFSNGIVYEKFIKDLTDEELGNYLLDLITDKILKKNGKNT